MNTTNIQSGKVCPECQTTISASQYAFNKKIMEVKCKGCGIDYKYDAPVSLIVALVMLGFLVALVPLLILWLTVDLSVGIYWFIGYIVLALILVSYIEAIYVQSKYSLNKC
jgi:uncharacterized protein (DUF983 family)